MNRRAMWFFLSSLFPLTLFALPSTLFSLERIPIFFKDPESATGVSIISSDMVVDAPGTSISGFTAAGSHVADPIADIFVRQLWWFAIERKSFEMLKEQALDSSKGISDRSALGPAPGGLSPIPRAINSCSAAVGVVFDPVGSHVLFTDSARDLVCVQSVDPDTQAFTPVPGSPFPAGGTSAERIAIDPSGQFVFVASSGSNNVSAFSFDLNTGALAPVPGSPYATGSQPLDVATDGYGRFVYVANNLSNSLMGFSIDPNSGALTPIAGSPFTMGNFLSRVAVDPLGRFLYAMDSQGVFVLSIGAGGALTPVAGSPLALNPAPSAIAADPTGQFLFVTQRANSLDQDDTVTSFRVNGNGSLTPIGSLLPLGKIVSPVAVAVDPGGLWVYVANLDDSSTAGFSLDPTTGILTPIPGSPFLAGESPFDVAVHTRLGGHKAITGAFFFQETCDRRGNTPL